MSFDDNVQLIYALGALVLVGSALIGRRLPMRDTIRMALIWIAIFAIGVAVIHFGQPLWGKMRGALSPETGSVGEGGVLRIPLSDDGHFWVRGQVNGVQTRFLVDSGASVSGLSEATVASAGIDKDGGFPAAVETANGTIFVRRIRIDTLAVGPIERHDLAAMTAAGFGDTNVLGMNFLSSLNGWSVERGVLILRP